MKTSSSKSDHGGCAADLSLATWRATHDQLLRGDAQYRKRFHSFLAIEVGLSCVLLVFYLPFFGIRLFAPAVNVAIVLSLAAVVVGLALRQLQHQRDCIRNYLELNRAARSAEE